MFCNFTGLKSAGPIDMQLVNPSTHLTPSATYMRHLIGSALVQVIPWCQDII